MQIHGRAEIHLQPIEEPMPEQVDAQRKLCGKPTVEQAPCKTCGIMKKGAKTGAGSLAGPVTPQGTHARAACSKGLFPVGESYAGTVHEELQPVGRTHVGEVCEKLSHMGRTSCWSERRV
ncbi:hypothetical protein HGM15179_010402 [Zosterops borbonicus]|uniref:Uncharacterized protein n=1 Tax=Zosterops borbonicus TaxID=364589 RepID=A0A8K1LK19_9PASS|nr:hypothetical protein HGM15179_010402 [Zosterops borbonicus]